MIGNLIALYRARKNPILAKRLASELLVEGAVDRASWPLAIAKFWAVVGIVVVSVLILLFLVIGIFTHWTLAIPALPLGGLIYGIVRLWRGVNLGVENVTKLAKREIGNRAAALNFPSRETKETAESS